MAVFSIIKLSELEGAKRIDAEYYKPEYLRVRDLLNSISIKEIREISRSVVSFGAYSLCNYIIFRENGVPYLNVENIKEGYIDWTDIKYIDDSIHKLLWKSRVREGQVILTMAGTIGNAAVAYKVPLKLNSNQATAKITMKKGYSPFYLAAFLNSYYGRIQTNWEIVSNVQPNIFLWQIKRIKVFIHSDKSFINEIEKLYINGLNLLNTANFLYSQAENLLLEELGLRDFKPKYEKTYTAKLSDAFSVHRIDAEYFQPAYEEVEKYLRKKFYAKPIKQLNYIEVTTGQYSEKYVDASKGLPYIRGTDLKMGTIDTADLVYISLEDQIEGKKAKEGDIVVTRVGTIGLSARIPKECEGGTISDNLIRLRFDQEKLNSYYLALFLGSPLGVSLMIRNSRGSVQQRLNQETLKEVVIPILPPSTQQKIASLVQQSHDARRKAKELLEEAKKKVEDAIENAQF